MKLESVRVTNFRSINGSAVVPLDAPVVLIHGANGTGKTSLMSAIEFALTGRVDALASHESSYKRFLPHLGSEHSEVGVSVRSNGLTQSSRLMSDGREWAGDTLLGGADSAFFSERCNLPQSILGRLLEIYQVLDDAKESPLSRFVKELLKLDRVDSVIDGLEFTRDIRNTRKSVPLWAAVESREEGIDAQIAHANREIQDMRDALQVERSQLLEILDRLLDGPEAVAKAISSDDIREYLSDNRIAKRRIGVLAATREIAVLQTQLRSVKNQSSVKMQAAGEPFEVVAQLAEDWWQGAGFAIERALDRLRLKLPNTPIARAIGAESAVTQAISLANTEIARLRAVISNHREAERRQSQSLLRLQDLRRELELLNAELSDVPADHSGIADALAQLANYIHDEQCPVCGRDYSEIGAGDTLRDHVHKRIGQRVGDQERWLAKSLRQKGVAAEIQDLERGLVDEQSRDSSGLAAVEGDLRHLSSSLESLTKLSRSAQEGDAFERRREQASHALVMSDNEKVSLAGIRTRAMEIRNEWLQSTPDSAQDLAGFLGRLAAALDSETKRLEQSAIWGNEASQLHADLREMQRDLASAEEDIDRLRARKISTSQTLRDAGKLRESARKTRDKLIRHRTEVTERAFSGAFNLLWSELFGRLAPSEQFSPSFSVTARTGKPPQVRLSTRDKNGTESGAPAAMLSAGNLNTAALTLFLALHLSTEVSLPWILLDDPVQSMDDVHISQFAALLRTLSKEHERQVIVAVHDRALFEYLRLELSPAFDSDALITVEISKDADNRTNVQSSRLVWESDDELIPAL